MADADPSDFANFDARLGDESRADGLQCPRCGERRLRSVRLASDRVGVLCRACCLQTVLDKPASDPWRSEAWFEVCHEHQARLGEQMRRERERYEAHQARIAERRAALDQRIAKRQAGKPMIAGFDFFFLEKVLGNAVTVRFDCPLSRAEQKRSTMLIEQRGADTISWFARRVATATSLIGPSLHLGRRAVLGQSRRRSKARQTATARKTGGKSRGSSPS